MLDYVSAAVAFWMLMFVIQEWVLEFRLGFLGRYWALMSAVSLFVGFLLSAPIVVPLIVSLRVDPFKFPDNIILSAIAAAIFSIIVSLGQWLILRKTELTPRIFALINTAVGILSFAVLVYLNEPHLEWSGGPIQGWKTLLIFLAGGAVTGAGTGKALDFYCARVEQRLIRIERQREEEEARERERLEREREEKRRLEEEAQEAERAERRRIMFEIAKEEERKWLEEHGKDYQDYDEDEDEDEEDE